MFFVFEEGEVILKNLVKYTIGALALAVSLAANAIPTLQIYMPGATAADGLVGGLSHFDQVRCA